MTPPLADAVVVIDWKAPYDQIAAYGAPITKYTVLIQQKDLQYRETSDCKGTDIDLIQNTQCIVQIATLRAAPYNLEHGMPIYAKIVAANLIGESDQSIEGTGSQVFVPVVPEAPISLQPTPSEITKTQASFTWSDGANGGKPILDYLVLYDQGVGVWRVLADEVV